VVLDALLNFTCTKLGSLDALGSNFVLIFILWRAFGGRKERKRRAVFAFGEKGLKTVDTSVMNLVIIFTGEGSPADVLDEKRFGFRRLYQRPQRR
jgi:F0F1-type ATP synthase assembly protein I